MGEVERFLVERGFNVDRSMASFYLAKRVAPRYEVGPPVWHTIFRRRLSLGPPIWQYRASQNARRGGVLVMDWESPWFDTVEACYLYAELNQWGM